jgi:hypothetical protein
MATRRVKHFSMFSKSFHSKEDCLGDKRCLTIATQKTKNSYFSGSLFLLRIFLLFVRFSRVINFLHRMLSLNRVKNNNQLFLIHPRFSDKQYSKATEMDAIPYEGRKKGHTLCESPRQGLSCLSWRLNCFSIYLISFNLLMLPTSAL